ncbi:hypothetical protein L228DRAFT_207027 [Xylona heveae TC161]|uniref:PQ loop repeat protein n=1 Tax=Xylona heveae (strain CBS 132557 / TC161) TaxID=1328760 RepID=A0A165K452_XYLHT|nr:hypothetical protein L228DRAFT_207027 [Xylona heveae TC161]KZF26961.1 hypothetical protein L228DRAFT_207027 [Xylona heveae TC161]
MPPWSNVGVIPPSLPDHCEPANEFLYKLSSSFHTCIPTNLAFISILLGTLSIVSWLFAQLPQIYKNYKIRSTAGLSIYFLIEWCLGDASNLLGALLTRQATWQVVVAGYYVCVDAILVGQWFWYEHILARWSRDNPHYINRVQPGTSPIVSLSPRTMLYISLLCALLSARPSVAAKTEISNLEMSESNPAEAAGRILSWLSTLLYLGSRLPQLYKNHVRRSTAGLSPFLFLAAFFGNLFYSSSLLTNPCAWNDFPSYGGGGWVGEEGNDRLEWVSLAAPFWLGAAGVLVLDATMGIQFILFGEHGENVVIRDKSEGRWRRVSGWMRGWMPSMSLTRTAGADAQQLLYDGRDGYGTV